MDLTEGDTPRRIAVLLGAGASRDAGLPLTSELAAGVVAKANQEDSFGAKPNWVRALNAVYAGMVGYQGASGEDPLSAVNIETLISAVRLLRDRDNHEVAPFVASWVPALSGFGSANLPRQSGKAILDAVNKGLGSRVGFADRDITEAVASIARAALRPDLKEPFADAERFVLRTLVDLLGAHRDVSYFSPLLELARAQLGGIDVITLNYDLTVETAASQVGLSVNRGVEHWNPGDYLDFPLEDGTINLMKLHGSLDWRLSVGSDMSPDALAPRQIEVIQADGVEETRGLNARALPWVVVGDREKLATDGPTLVLNFAARAALLRTSHLVVIGYSFGDTHINAMIRDWLGGNSERTVTILDVSFPHFHHFDQQEDFRSALINRYGGSFRPFGPPEQQRVFPLEGTAAKSLAQALSLDFMSEPASLAEARLVRFDDHAQLRVTWHGPDLTEVRLSARSLKVNDGPLPVDDKIVLSGRPLPPGGLDGWANGVVRYDSCQLDETVTAYLSNTFDSPIEVTITGASTSGSKTWKAEVEI